MCRPPRWREQWQGYPDKDVPSEQFSVAGTAEVRESCAWLRRLLVAGPRNPTDYFAWCHLEVSSTFREH